MKNILRLIAFAIVMLMYGGLAWGQGVYVMGSSRATDTNKVPAYISIFAKNVRLTQYASSDTNKVLGINSAGDLVLRTKGGASSTPNLQSVLTSGDSSGVGRVVLADYVNTDPISGVSEYSSFVTRKAHESPTEPVVTMQINDRFIATDELMTVPMYAIKTTPIFQITDSANSAMRYAGIVSDINVDSAHSEGYFKSAWMVQSGGHFGYPGARVQHYAGYVAHNPVIWDTCDNAYGIKIGGFNSGNYKNATALAIGFVSQNIGGHWSIYTSQHIGYNNYLGSGRTILGLASSDEIDSSATLQTETITTTGLIKSTSDLSGDLTDLSYPQKVYVDNAIAAIPSIDTTSLSDRIDSKVSYVDTASILSAYLRKSGWAMTDAGILTAPSTGVLKGTNGNLHINDNDTASSSRQGVWANLSAYYTNTSGVSRGFTVFGSSVSSSGSARNIGYSYSGTLNRTGTSTGIDAAFEVAPTLTSVIDFRGLHLNYNNANAWGVVQTGSLSPNYFAGEFRLGSNADAGTYQLQVTGNSYFNGTTTGISYADLSFPFTNTSAGTLNPALNTTYNFTGTTSTWTLPVVSGNSGKFIEVMNVGTGDITVNSNAGGNDIFTSSAVNTTTVAAGATVTFFNNGTYWKLK